MKNPTFALSTVVLTTLFACEDFNPVPGPESGEAPTNALVVAWGGDSIVVESGDAPTEMEWDGRTPVSVAGRARDAGGLAQVTVVSTASWVDGEAPVAIGSSDTLLVASGTILPAHQTPMEVRLVVRSQDLAGNVTEGPEVVLRAPGCTTYLDASHPECDWVGGTGGTLSPEGWFMWRCDVPMPTCAGYQPALVHNVSEDAAWDPTQVKLLNRLFGVEGPVLYVDGGSSNSGLRDQQPAEGWMFEIRPNVVTLDMQDPPEGMALEVEWTR